MPSTPVRVTEGSLTALAEGARLAIYDASSLSVRTLDLPSPPEREEVVRTILRSIDGATSHVPARGLQLPVYTPTFEPLVARSGERNRLSRLTLNIANACNLWCSYCYADHGQYHAPNSLMTPERALKAVRRCLELYSRIDTIQFFGGEPLLNPDAIAAVANSLTGDGAVQAPSLVATTNGTVLPSKTADVLQRFAVGLTISLDGPPEIHDRLRPGKRGAPSHAAILRNIEKLRGLGVEIDFECTYTTAHYQAGITVCDLLDYFWRELGEAQPHISWSYLPRPLNESRDADSELGMFREDYEVQARQYFPPPILAQLFRDGARKSMENIATGDGAVLSFVQGILHHLATREPASVYCPAFTSQLSIATSGDVYPCFMFIGDPRLQMGNIFDPCFPDEKAAAVWARHRTEFGTRATGSDAWYSGLNGGCIAGDYIATGTLGERLYESVYEAMIEEVILGLVRHLEQ